MNNNYVSLNRSLQTNTFETFTPTPTPTPIVINSNFLNYPVHTRNYSSQNIQLPNQTHTLPNQTHTLPNQTHTLPNQTHIPVQFISFIPIQYFSQSQNHQQLQQPLQQPQHEQLQPIHEQQQPIQQPIHEQQQPIQQTHHEQQPIQQPQHEQLQPIHEQQQEHQQNDILKNFKYLQLHDTKTSQLKTVIQTPEFNELKNNLDEIKKKLDLLPIVSKPEYEIDCDKKINVVKNELLDKIDKINNKNKDTKNNYINDLFELLKFNQILSDNEINNIKNKLSTNEIDHDTVISFLENKKKLTKHLQFNQYKNNNFNDVLSGKWQVPMPRPPVCITTDNNKVYQYDAHLNNYSLFKKN